jgi:primosomal protein N' (replication factor Y)
VGTQQVVEKLKEHFPHIKVLRMDNDTTQNKDSHANILHDFVHGEARILVGTQMIAKGHDIASVNFVGIIDADMSLHFADYRACERTFQLITQVSGRAGRDKKEGAVVLQTYSPNHYVYRFAIKGDYKGFYDKECNLREVTKYPPFSTIIRVLISSEVELHAQNTLKSIFDCIIKLKQDFVEKSSPFIYLACMRSPIKRIQSKYRMQVLMRIQPHSKLTILNHILEIIKKFYSDKCSIFVEINPSNLS